MKLSTFKNAAIAAAIAVVIGILALLLMSAILSKVSDPAILIAPCVYIIAFVIGAIGAILAIKLSKNDQSVITVIIAMLYIIALISAITVISGGAQREGYSIFPVTLALSIAGAGSATAVKYLRPQKGKKRSSHPKNRTAKSKSRH